MYTSENQKNSTSSTGKEQSTHREGASYKYRILQWVTVFIFALVAFSLEIVLILRWINPPTSSFMLQRQFTAWQQDEEIDVEYQWTDWEQISPAIKMAAITSEDQSFAYHWGLDFDSIEKAINEYQHGDDLRGASTITQQVAKNLFLWPQQSYLRKGIEAYFAVLIELFWSKQRILEVYLNIVEFGDGVYGVHAAAKRYFHTTPDKLSKWQSALMVTALPAPKRYNLAHPSQYMIERRTWILRYMDLLGERYYLEQLE